MHPFFHPYLSTGIDQGEEDQELHLDLLEEAVIQSPCTEEDLHLPKSDQPTLHILKDFGGLYHNPESKFNKDRKIPQFPSYHLEENYKLAILDSGWSLPLSAHLYVPSATYLPLFCAIKNKYEASLLHLVMCAEYLCNLFEPGMVCRKGSNKRWECCLPPIDGRHNRAISPSISNSKKICINVEKGTKELFPRFHLRNGNKTEDGISGIMGT